MCMTSTPDAPPPPAITPEAPVAPDTEAGARTSSNRRRRAAAGNQSRGGTILTGSRGVQNGAPTTAKTLLGQ